MPKTPVFRKLRIWNAVLAVLHLSQAVLMFVMSPVSYTHLRAHET